MKNGENGLVYDIHKVSSASVARGTPINTKVIGKYDSPKHVILKNSKIDYNLQKTYLILGAMIPKTPKGSLFIEYLEGKGHGHLDSQLRCAYRFTIIFADMFNFTIKVKRASSSGYLKPYSSNWSGVTGMMQRKEIDISNAAMVYSVPRHPVIDSGLAASKFRQFFLFRHPSGAGHQINVYLAPLDYLVWISILLVSLLAAFIFYVIFIYEKKLDGGDANPFTTSILIVVGALAQQGVDTAPSFHSRIGYFFFLLLAFFCFQFYSAQIVGSLLAPEPRTITNLKRLRMSSLKMVLEDVPTSTPMFNISNNDDAVELYLKRVRGKEVFMKTVEDGILKVKEGGYAFFTFIDYAYDVAKKMLSTEEIDELQEIPIFHKDQSENIYLPVQKHSPFKEPIRIGMLRITEAGIKDYWMNLWTAKPPIGDLSFWKFAVVDWNRFKSLFYFLCMGLAFSLILFIGEIIVARYVDKATKGLLTEDEK
ncbi:glutamate receptor ionotropic, kainate 2-like [Culicoides brevitarsis]|uniref:glutamate receptor ionotropic, kainate 2-like n=1 Tax=Culicoides brevitarsis TaxID=469753 RepID=UPI00307CBC17